MATQTQVEVSMEFVVAEVTERRTLKPLIALGDAVAVSEMPYDPDDAGEFFIQGIYKGDPDNGEGLLIVTEEMDLQPGDRVQMILRKL